MIHGHSKRITGRMIAMDSEALPEDVKQLGGKTMVENQRVKNVPKTTKDPTSAWSKDSKKKKEQKHKKDQKQKTLQFNSIAQQEESERLRKEKRKIKIFDYSLLLLVCVGFIIIYIVVKMTLL